ncbi:MAG: hypothetical protein LQ343_004498 [Gyalolechia ehrenbergii]|nr:MAG: hypothetical protein LQ343_004498 [Gyalolechia ehrenbergii]
MDPSFAARATDSLQNPPAPDQASEAISVAETSKTTVGSSVATIGNTEPQSLDGPLLRLSDNIIAELRRSLAALETARRYQAKGSLEKIFTEANSFRDTLGARVQQYDASLKQLRDGTDNLSKDSADRAAALEVLKATCEKKLGELNKVREEETGTRSKLDKLSSDLESAKKNLNWTTGRVRITMGEERKLKESMEQDRKKIEQETGNLEAKRTTLQQQEQIVGKTREALATKIKEQYDREANLLELERTTQQSLKQHDDQLTTLNSAITTLRSTLNLLGLPATYESIETDAEAIAKLVNQKIESLLQQTSDLRGQLSAKATAVQKHQRQLKETEDDKRQLVANTHALKETVNQLRAALGDKEEAMEARCSELSRLTQQVDFLEREGDDKLKKLEAENKGRIGDLAARDLEISRLTSRVALLDEEGNKYQESLRRLERDHRDSVEALSARDLEVSQQKSHIESLTAHVTALQSYSPRRHEASLISPGRANFFEAEIQAVQQQLADLAIEKKSALEKAGDLERRLAAAEGELRSHKATSVESSVLHDRIRDLERDRTAATNSAQAEAMNFQPRIDHLVAQLSNAIKGRDELQSRIQDLESRHSEVDRRGSQPGAGDTRALQERIEELEGQLSTATRALEETSTSVNIGNASRKRRREETSGALSEPDNGEWTDLTAASMPCDVLQWDLNDVKRDDFQCTLVPEAIIRDVQRQISRWDSLRADWLDGASKGKAKCAERHASRSSAVLRTDEACSFCTDHGLVCVKLSGGKLEPLPVPLEKRGLASRDTVQYWKVV